MGKFGSFGGFKAGNLGATVSKAVNKVQNKVNNMSPEELTGIMEKATIGNAAQFIGNKAGVKVNAGKIDGIVNRFGEAKSAIRAKFLNTVLDAVEQSGYKISIPSGEAFAQYLMDNHLLDNIDEKIENIDQNAIRNTIQKLDIPKVASDLGFSITKIPEENPASVLNGKDQTVMTKLNGVGTVIGSGLDGVITEVGNAASDIKQIAESKGE